MRAMQASEADTSLTPAEQQVLSALSPLWDADPETIANLRRHTAAVGLARPQDYEGAAALRIHQRLDRDLRRLFKMGDQALWVGEPAALGGFGVTGLAPLYNADTVRGFRVLSLLQDAAVLRHFRGAGRRTVWEIGGGWGGFAYQFTRACPNVTYLITAMPALLLASAVYLMTLCPGARIRFYDPAAPDAFWRNWDEVDFAFAPESRVAGMPASGLDLAVDLGALEQMSPSRVASHVQRAHDLRATYFFSTYASATGDGAPPSAVEPAVERLYWRHPVSAPAYLDRRLAVPAGTSYLLGWRRLHA